MTFAELGKCTFLQNVRFFCACTKILHRKQNVLNVQVIVLLHYYYLRFLIVDL